MTVPCEDDEIRLVEYIKKIYKERFGIDLKVNAKFEKLLSDGKIERPKTIKNTETINEPLNIKSAAEVYGEGKKKTNKKSRKMEVDLFLHDTTDSVAVEVKIHCTRKKIVHFLERMQMFKQIFTEFAHNKIYVAVAAINFDKEAVEYAQEKGVFLIHAKDDVFTLEPADRDKMLVF